GRRRKRPPLTNSKVSGPAQRSRRGVSSASSVSRLGAPVGSARIQTCALPAESLATKARAWPSGDGDGARISNEESTSARVPLATSTDHSAPPVTLAGQKRGA